jgi:ribosome silencing factor RsfS/YbeB/iojap
MTATRPKRKRNAPAAKKTRTGPGALTKIAIAALEDMKAVNVKVMDVRKLTDVTDTMIVATGTSDRHMKSIADRVIERCREAGHRTHGIEGEREGEESNGECGFHFGLLLIDPWQAGSLRTAGKWHRLQSLIRLLKSQTKVCATQ